MGKQNIKWNTIDGVINVQFEACFKCKYFNDCYVSEGHYHKGVPQYICQECSKDNEKIK